MFKIESYIAPILLSYVDKYIKNFRLEDSQVSLWGGDALFQNLDLRLEVLEQELQSPFSFISGHIKELSIHVPWTRLTSEPITITINTIECVLKLKDSNDGAASDLSPQRDKQRKPTGHKVDDEAPPNYVQSLVNKIVSNMRIFCNNVILKYVEEDIVLSMNVKHLKVESCNEKWKAAYIDVSPTQVVLRKIVSVNDLTICLDKRNASGKIDIYQEPMLYRCSMTMHMLRTYQLSTVNKTSLTRLDIYCNKMEFSMTEQQIPMFLRLMALLHALNQKRLQARSDLQDNGTTASESKEMANSNESWAGWAWSYVSAVLPTQSDDDDPNNEQLLIQSGHIVQIGFYVDDASLTFKVSETSDSKGYYSQRKTRYYPLLTLHLQGIYNEIISVGRKWVNALFGVSEIIIVPVGSCSCAYPEPTETLPYLTLGSKSTNHKCNSLFDAEALENIVSGQCRTYNTNWDFHMFTNTPAVILERTPALGCDYLYQMELPEDSTSDLLSDLSSNLEYSNMAERAKFRTYIGALKLRVCSGLFHRTDSLKVAAMAYDYPPYYIPKPDLLLQDLLPPSEEDFDALNEFIPTRTMEVMVFEPVIELYFMDHPVFEASKKLLFKRPKKLSTSEKETIQLQKIPKLTLECKSLEVNVSNPMYMNRLIHTTCQLPDAPEKMFEACFSKMNVHVIGLSSRIILKESLSTTLLVPFNLSYESRSILSPQYWVNPDVSHTAFNFLLENFTFNCTKPKLIVVSHLISSILKRNTDGLKSLRYTSLLYDACKDYAMPYMELSIEGIRFKKATTNATVLMDLALDSVKAFVFESQSSQQQPEIQQVLFLSGPEPKQSRENLPLFVVTVQYPIKPDLQPHPSFIIFNLQEVNFCVDPLVCKWLIYHPVDIALFRDDEERCFTKYPDINTTETIRRSNSQIESVHSSSDALTHQKLSTVEEEQPAVDEKLYNYLKTWHPVWKNMIVNGHIAQAVLYFPMASISSVGSQGIEDAVRGALTRDLLPYVMVISLPVANIHSAQKQSIVKYLTNFPVKLPNTSNSSFPWTLEISDLNCHSMEPGKEIQFLKTVSISATVGLSTKSENNSGSIGLYVHVDVTPIFISVSEDQVALLSSLVYGLSDFFSSLTPKRSASPRSLEPGVTLDSPSLSPTGKDNTLDNTSGTMNQNPVDDASDANVKLTAWIQWTVTKFSLELLSNTAQIKLVIDVEDIVSSLDYQNVYLKLKKKVGSISVRHYKRSNDGWTRGPFSGVLVRLREDITVEKRPEDGGFLGVTITRASSQHTHNLWGTTQKNKEKRPLQTLRFLTEIVISVQPIDIILPVQTLLQFVSIFTPFLSGGADKATASRGWFTNQNLPLAYLECREIRILFPSFELQGSLPYHDVVIVEMEKISFTPSATNPVCRAPIRPDIYRQAAQARLLQVPGSELEDRQYQLDVVGFSVTTTTWRDLQQLLNMPANLIENPALEWNNLKQGKLTIAPTLNFKQVVEKVEISVVAAPTMLYKNEIVICGSSFEINFVTDITMLLSLDQVKLVSAICNEVHLPHVEPFEEKMNPFTQFPMSYDLDLELTEFYKDSGIDTSEMRSALSAKSQPVLELQKLPSPTRHPSEMLFTAGKITICLYQMSLTSRIQRRYLDEDDRNYEASEEESIDETVLNHKKYTPLVCVSLSQPNLYNSRQQYAYTTHISCFDFAVKLGQNHQIPSIPAIKDFTIDLISTRSGYPDNHTGILPAFFTLKYSQEYGKNSTYHIDMSRPTKLSFSTNKITSLMALWNKLMENLPVRTTEERVEEPKTSRFRALKQRLHRLDLVEFKTDQLVFLLETSGSLEVNLTLTKTKTRVFSNDRPEKIQLFSTLDCVTVSVSNAGVKRGLLNPWTVSLETSAVIEPWQSTDSEPLLNLSIDSDCLIVDVNPEQLQWLERICKETAEFAASFSSSRVRVEQPELVPERDQYYKDDLRAGAFQFIEAVTPREELPLPYQVMFWNHKDLSAMAWRYPQPRSLTKVRIFPVPMEASIDAEPVQVTCSLQYWSEYHCAYIAHASFNLSETEVCYLELPKMEPQRAVACVWRVLLTSRDSAGNQVRRNFISPTALAACMRIDSYFNKSIVPVFTMVVYVSKLELSLVSTFKSTRRNLPGPLEHFTSDKAFPETHSFCRIAFTNLRQHFARWDSQRVYLDLSGLLRCTALDYMFLNEQCILEQLAFKGEINCARQLRVRLVTNPIQLVFAPGITHTLAVNSQLWGLTDQEDFVVFTRYVICNDTNINLRFGQVNTDEDILLPSRQFHLYCWRSVKSKRKIKVAFAERGWLWSKSFDIEEGGTRFIPLSSDSNLSVIVTVKELSKTQKQVIVAGQFLISNMLLDHFEFKIVAEGRDDKDLKKAPIHTLTGNSVTPSMFLDHRIQYYMRLRFSGLESAWTGDIPLKEHTKGAWLVKVPLQERSQFLSIWCRIVLQDFEGDRRILAMLWPLFMIKSNLPTMSNIHIKTPTLNAQLNSTISGKGELQQLHCPGTIDDSHQLTIHLNDGTSISNSYIPLDYSLVDQQKFFKKNENEDIEEILESLKQQSSKSTWPYFEHELNGIDWVIENQRQTVTQVRYQNASPYSSALSVELIPWCLMVNTFGCPISIMVNGSEICKVPQHGLVAPPKLDNNFHLGVDVGGGWFYSSILQLSTSDWSQAFYMPKISGTLPIDGTIKTVIRCEDDIAIVSITSSVWNEMRLLKVSSSHVLSNYLTNQIQVVCFAIPESDTLYEIPLHIDDLSFSIAPQCDKTHSGISIVRWHLLDTKDSNDSSNYALYVAFCFQYEWSGPIRVDTNTSRKSFSLKTPDNRSIPLVITSQERKGQIFLSLYQDDCPQTLIVNKLKMKLCCAQWGDTGANTVIQETKNFTWFTTIDCGRHMYYTMPFVADKFPELPQTSFSEKIVFALLPEGQNPHEWSTPISITSDLEQYVKIPTVGDVKFTVKATSFTTLITIDQVDDMEISAIDIRGRLSRLENEFSSGALHDLDESTGATMARNTSQRSVLYDSLFVPTIPKYGCDSVEILIYVKSFSVGFLLDHNAHSEKRGIANFIFDGIGVELLEKDFLEVNARIAEIQFDNELYSRESYDFPVVLVSQEPKPRFEGNILEKSLDDLMASIQHDSLLTVNLLVETWIDMFHQSTKTRVKDVKVNLNPLSLYIEDVYINKLIEYFNSLIPMRLMGGDKCLATKMVPLRGLSVRVPEVVFWESSVVGKPLNSKSITLEPISLLLSVHSSMKLYIALDQSPLQFARFERKRLLTTSYRLGHAMTMHYLSGAIFGAGWVVSSLELLGSPSGLARAMGIGLRDFINMPYRGLIQGPWAFLAGVTHGSASLMKHVTAGTLQSVTKLASSVARNLDRLTLDEEHLRRTEEQRRLKPQGITQGFMQGLTGLGISLLGAVGGIAHHPLQSIMSDRASPRSLAASLGLGIVGVFTKPLSGAAELVALTGQGLLQGAGWNSLPQPRGSLLDGLTSIDVASPLRYEWKLLNSLSYKNVLYLIEATIFNVSEFKGVVLILTTDALIIVNIDDDSIRRVVPLTQLHALPSECDPTHLLFKILKKIEEEYVVEMDPACRARVADYVKSTASLLQIAGNEGNDAECEAIPEVINDNVDEQFGCYVNPQSRNYFLCLLALAKQLNNGFSFSVL